MAKRSRSVPWLVFLDSSWASDARTPARASSGLAALEYRILLALAALPCRSGFSTSALVGLPTLLLCTNATSRPNDLELRVQSFQLDAGVGGLVNCQLALAWRLLRWSCHAATSRARICLSAMRSRHCEAKAPSSDFGQVEPTAVLGRVVPFEALDEPARLGRGKGLIERGWLVGVEIILQQHDFRRVGKMRGRTSP